MASFHTTINDIQATSSNRTASPTSHRHDRSGAERPAGLTVSIPRQQAGVSSLSPRISEIRLMPISSYTDCDPEGISLPAPVLKPRMSALVPPDHPHSRDHCVALAIVGAIAGSSPLARGSSVSEGCPHRERPAEPFDDPNRPYAHRGQRPLSGPAPLRLVDIFCASMCRAS